MKWTNKYSVWLTRICSLLAVIVMLLVFIFVDRYSYYMVGIARGVIKEGYLIITIRSCVGVAFVMLYILQKLIQNIQNEITFTEGNIKYLRCLSWLCMAEAMIFFISGLYYWEWVVIGCIAAFIGLILRVIKNVFCQAFIIKEENDYTI